VRPAPSDPRQAKGETNVESQTPPGSKPPVPQQPAPPEQPWISPRLRDKLGDPDPGAPKEGPAPWVGIVLVLLVIGGGAGLFVTMRSGAAKQKADAEQASHARATEAAAESTANAAKIDSMRAVVAARAAADSAAGKPSAAAAQTGAPAKSPAAGGTATSSRAAAATPPAGGDAAPATPKVVEKGPFGLDVGTFLAEERATSELARLSTATGLKGKVVTRNEDGGDVYHVVLGSFATRGAADKRAESLVARALVNQAQSVSLAP
jgi:sporulation related protein